MINIAEKLKNCPKGFELYSPLFGTVTFHSINDDKIIINTPLNCLHTFSIYGQYFGGYSNSECLLFPSRQQKDWNDFCYKKPPLDAGHRVMVSDNRNIWALYLYYGEGNKTVPLGLSRPPEPANIFTWEYIVPIEQFDFSARDITINCQKSIV